MTVVAFMHLSLMCFVPALAASVAIMLLLGRIRAQRLLHDKRSGGFSPARAQALVMTLAGGAAYFAMVLTANGSLPEVPTELTVALGGSQSLFLGAKFLSGWRDGLSRKLGSFGRWG